jgi:hypothetical protein
MTNLFIEIALTAHELVDGASDITSAGLLLTVVVFLCFVPTF